MFTGIIRQTGKIADITKKEGLTELTIEAPEIASTRQIGDSVAVDGVCLTVTALGNNSTSRAVTAIESSQFTVQAIPETLARTIIKQYKENTLVNLETPMKLGDELHGHLVQGHVDFTGTVTGIKAEGNSKKLEITFPPDYAKFFALKGSVTVNGTSLTISNLHKNSFEVSLIPETLASTNLQNLAKGSPVNIEVDLIARYLNSLLDGKEKETTYNFLQERGFL